MRYGSEAKTERSEDRWTLGGSQLQFPSNYLFSLERSGDWKVVAQEVSDFQYGQRTQFYLIFCRQYASQRLALQKFLSQRSIGFG
jgi:hypothetical protein